MQSRSIDVLIVTYNSAATIAQAITSVRDSPDVNRIIVVDNASSDDSAYVCRNLTADVVIESGTNRGFAAGVNLALGEADSPYVLLLNPDATIEPDMLHGLLTRLREDETAALAAPVLHGSDGSICYGARRFSTVTNRVSLQIPLLRKLTRGPEYREADLFGDAGGQVRVDYLWGAVLLVDRAFLVEAGGLDERYFMYSEDEDIARTAVSRGRSSLLVTSAVAGHVGAVSSAGRRDIILARQMEANRILLGKWHGDWSARAYLAGMRLAFFLQAIVAAARGRREDAHSLMRLSRGAREGG